MVVGVCRIELGIEWAFSLKAKRSVVRKVLGRVRNHFPVSAAEVDEQDIWNRAVLGFAVVGNDRAKVNALLNRLIQYVEDLGLGEVQGAQLEILNW